MERFSGPQTRINRGKGYLGITSYILEWALVNTVTTNSTTTISLSKFKDWEGCVYLKFHKPSDYVVN